MRPEWPGEGRGGTPGTKLLIVVILGIVTGAAVIALLKALHLP